MSSNNWLNFAVDDIDSAQIMLREGKYNNVCYFSHQAVEKSLKAFLYQNNYNPPRIHNLIELLKECQKANDSFALFISNVRVLNQFYIPTRYPVIPKGSLPTGMPGKTLAEKALNYAIEIVDYCKSSID